MTAENKKNSLEKPFLTTREAAAWLGTHQRTRSRKCGSMATDRSTASTVVICAITSTTSWPGRRLASESRPPMSRDPARLRGQMTVLAIVSIALVATIAVPTNAHLPWLIYNASGSASLGFHAVENRAPSRRNMVVGRPSVTIKKLLANHGVLPRGVLFGSTQLPSPVTIFVGSRACYTRAARPPPSRSTVTLKASPPPFRERPG
jgi:hypothetical protein